MEYSLEMVFCHLMMRYDVTWTAFIAIKGTHTMQANSFHRSTTYILVNRMESAVNQGISQMEEKEMRGTNDWQSWRLHHWKNPTMWNTVKNIYIYPWAWEVRGSPAHCYMTEANCGQFLMITTSRACHQLHVLDSGWNFWQMRQPIVKPSMKPLINRKWQRKHKPGKLS